MAVQLDQIRATAQRVAASHIWTSSISSFRAAANTAPCASLSRRTQQNEPHWLSRSQPEPSELPKGVPVEIALRRNPRRLRHLRAGLRQPYSTWKTSSRALNTPWKSLLPASNASSSGPKTTPPVSRQSWSSSRPSLRSTTTASGKAVSQNFQTVSSPSTSLPSSRRAKQRRP